MGSGLRNVEEEEPDEGEESDEAVEGESGKGAEVESGEGREEESDEGREEESDEGREESDEVVEEEAGEGRDEPGEVVEEGEEEEGDEDEEENERLEPAVDPLLVELPARPVDEDMGVAAVAACAEPLRAEEDVRDEGREDSPETAGPHGDVAEDKGVVPFEEEEEESLSRPWTSL